ncbi:tRNA 2-thiouridine(34) synthase MnmA [Rickettsiales bacterium]|nr:tRNA 2-thiouridine(34) synthase MnmA [Rickettsiales bacterium]
MYNLGFNKYKSKITVIVAMSGGVDSSVVACKLQEEGYNVIGITLQLYDMGSISKKKNSCCAGIDVYDAKKVAAKYNFPHYIINYQSNFKNEVIDDFVESYINGQTPIPCVKCNQSVKFRDLLKVAKDLGADCLATGHYIKQVKNNNNIFELHRALDNNKDQSYFLFATTYEQLTYLRFPLGNNDKEYTRKEAARLGLEIASKPDSQDICFVPNGDYASVIKKYRPQSFKKGDILHIESKKKLGQHQGIINYTLGQRRKIGISSPSPLYVVKIDSNQNIIYVGEEKFLHSQNFKIRDINWLAIDIKDKIIKASVKLRSSQEPQPAKITINNDNSADIIMKSMTKAITPGQACVIYSDQRMLGGGWII